VTDVNGRASFAVGAAETLFPTRARTISNRGVPGGYPYDVSRDGQKFLINTSVAGAQTGTVPITLVVNWIEGLNN